MRRFWQTYVQCMQLDDMVAAAWLPIYYLVYWFPIL